MLLFLARHACSEASNSQWQTPDSKIGGVGKKQAKVLSERSRFSRLDKIFSSKWERSRKTAEIISNKLKIETEVLDYIHEREQIPEIYGSSRDSKISKEYVKGYYDNYGNLDWKFKNKEESIKEVLKRASRLTKFLEKYYKGKRILVVSHDVFIKCFIGMALLGKNYSDKAMTRVINSLTMSHTGISLLINSSQKGYWKINYLNDYSHLKHVVERKN